MQVDNNNDIDPIQEAYNKASYDVKKYLEGEEFARTVSLIIQANWVNEALSDEINFICLTLVLKILPFDNETEATVTGMLQAAGADAAKATQIWSDILTYIVPKVPELGDEDDGIIINRIIEVGASDKVTHFGPDQVALRLKSVGAPRISLKDLSKGAPLLSSVNIIKKPDNIIRPVNHDTHLDPYREPVEE